MATTQRKTAKTEKTITGAVCPFCSLLCDDLTVKTTESSISLLRNTCPNAKQGFDKLVTEHTAPSVGQSETKLHTAVSATAEIIAQSQQVAFGGLGTDVDALRTLYKLAAKCGAVIDHMHSENALANVSVMQTLGWYNTTLSEVKNRADVILIVGADCKNKYARFIEKILEPTSAISAAARKSRRVIYLGPRKNAPSSKKLPVEIIPCEQSEIATLLSVLRAQVAKKSLQTELPQHKNLAALAEQLRQAKYANIVWSANALAPSQSRLCIETISRLVGQLNETTRAAGLPLGGDEGGMSAQQVSSWLSGFPLRVSYAQGIPAYDPRENKIETMLSKGGVDCLVWVDAFGRSMPPKLPSAVRLIYIGHPQIGKQLNADVCIPVGLPGVHHSARLVRTDAVVTVPLDRLYRTKLPSVKSVADSLLVEV